MRRTTKNNSMSNNPKQWPPTALPSVTSYRDFPVYPRING
jgi:hypothetical protein